MFGVITTHYSNLKMFAFQTPGIVNGSILPGYFGIEAGQLLALAASIAVLTALIGLSASRDVFRTTPMEAIREE